MATTKKMDVELLGKGISATREKKVNETLRQALRDNLKAEITKSKVPGDLVAIHGRSGVTL